MQSRSPIHMIIVPQSSLNDKYGIRWQASQQWMSWRMALWVMLPALASSLDSRYSQSCNKKAMQGSSGWQVQQPLRFAGYRCSLI